MRTQIYKIEQSMQQRKSTKPKTRCLKKISKIAKPSVRDKRGKLPISISEMEQESFY